MTPNNKALIEQLAARWRSQAAPQQSAFFQAIDAIYPYRWILCFASIIISSATFYAVKPNTPAAQIACIERNSIDPAYIKQSPVPDELIRAFGNTIEDKPTARYYMEQILQDPNPTYSEFAAIIRSTRLYHSLHAAEKHDAPRFN